MGEVPLCSMVTGPTMKWLVPNVTKPIVSDDGSTKYLMDALVLAQVRLFFPTVLSSLTICLNNTDESFNDLADTADRCRGLPCIAHFTQLFPQNKPAGCLWGGRTFHRQFCQIMYGRVTNI